MRLGKVFLTLTAPALLTFCLAACSNSQTTASGTTTPEGANANAVASSNTNAPTTAVTTTAASPVESLPRIIFILDASGSMQGKVGNEEKMAAARRVLKDSITKLPDAAHVGLIAYGHRSASDCNDIETLSPLGPMNRAALAGQIDALKPKGKTPITNSLQKAFDEVRAQAAGGPGRGRFGNRRPGDLCRRSVPLDARCPGGRIEIHHACHWL